MRAVGVRCDTGFMKKMGLFIVVVQKASCLGEGKLIKLQHQSTFIEYGTQPKRLD